MKQTFPNGRALSNSERVRIFEADKPVLEEMQAKTGLEADEIKRRAIHVGLPELADLLGIELKKPRKAA